MAIRKGVLPKKFKRGVAAVSQPRSEFLLSGRAFNSREELLSLLRVGLELGLRLLESLSKLGNVAGRGSDAILLDLVIEGCDAMTIYCPKF